MPKNYIVQKKSIKANPDLIMRKKLEKKFDHIVSIKSSLPALNKQQASSAHNKPKLLYVLAHPKVPTNTNQIERDLREKVIKRKISLFNRSLKGVRS